MEVEEGSRFGPSEAAALSEKFFSDLVNAVKKRGIDEDDAEDLVQNATETGWKAYDRRKGDPKTLPALIRHILFQQTIPGYFRGQYRTVKGLRVMKQERIDSLSALEQQSAFHEPSDSNLDCEALYSMMMESLETEKLQMFLDALREARVETDKKQFIKRAASIAAITEKDARNRFRQIKSKLKSNPQLLNHVLDA